MFDHLQQREVFHLVFLREFARRVKPGTFAIKGGCNLRFFFGSPRYSEDLDLDVASIEPFKLKETVMGILESPALSTSMRIYGVDRIIPPNIAKAKQTETVQRFKIHLMNAAGEELFTKVEFSRRGLEKGVTVSPVVDAVVRDYRLPPLLLPHYPLPIAVRQKVGALAGRSATQARDVFDLYLLSSRMDEAARASVQKELSAQKRKAAESALFLLTFESFRDTVCGFLGAQDAAEYAKPEVWDEMQLKVAALITGEG